MLVDGSIYPIDKIMWSSPIVIVPKKNGMLCVCIEYHKLNATTMTDPFPIPFTYGVLGVVLRHEMYLFLDGFNRYNHVMDALENLEKISFVTEWGAFSSNVMTFGMKNVPTTFTKMV